MTTINRGIELILSGGFSRKQPKDFHIMFEKVISLLKREITVHFEFSIKLDKRK
jgi:hypothetical protein